METNTGKDRISNLPWDVLDGILVRLPLKEAVRTSILSPRWRHNWIRLSQFVIIDNCIPNWISDTVARWKAIMEILRQVQSLHTGPIEKFRLAAYCRPDHYDLDQWIHFLTDKGLKEFILQEFCCIRRFHLPSCLFSCPLLSRLEIFGCTIKPSSADIGLKSLTRLQLNQVSIDSYMLERIIRNSPVLERLTLLNTGGSHIALRIHNPSLKYLKVDSNFDDIVLDDSPSLACVDIGLRERVLGYGEGKLIRVLGCLHNIKKLTLSSAFLGCLGHNDLPHRLPTMLQHLSVLEFKDVRLDSTKEVMVCLCILRSAPNLEELTLSVAQTTAYSKPDVELLLLHHMSNLYFEQLKVANVRAKQNVSTEWIFIKLLLVNSPMLKKMTVVHYGNDAFPREVMAETVPASRDVEILNVSV